MNVQWPPAPASPLRQKVKVWTEYQPQKRLKTGQNKHFACDYPGCGYSADKKTPLTQHKRIHTNERPYECGLPGCDYRAKTSGHATVHRRTHLDKDQLPFKCGVCPFTSGTSA